jgi:hypothetical protein
MVLNKIYRHFREKNILDIKYIIVEIALIFTGITLAAKYNNYQSQLRDEAFLKETIIQIHEELKIDKKINFRYYKFLNNKINGLNSVQEYILSRNLDSLNSSNTEKIFSNLPNTLSLSNSTIGFNRLKEKNLNLIKNGEIRKELINYYDHMYYNLKDVEDFNRDINEIKPCVFKYLKNYDFWNKTYDSITNSDELFEDRIFENRIGFITTNLKTYEDIINKGILPKSNSLIEALEKEYPYLKEENK